MTKPQTVFLSTFQTQRLRQLILLRIHPLTLLFSLTKLTLPIPPLMQQILQTLARQLKQSAYLLSLTIQCLSSATLRSSIEISRNARETRWST